MSTTPDSDSTELLRDADVKPLLARIGLEDKTAFDRLYTLTGTMLYSIAYSLMGSEAEAKDAFQEALVKIWQRARSYDPEKGNAVAWLARITRNTCLDKLRARKRRHAAVDRAMETAAAESAAAKRPDGEQQLMSSENRKRLVDAMAKLPPQQRIAIELAFLKGLTQSEVADQLQEPLGTVKARIRRGMLKLQSSLKSYPS